MMTRTYDPAKLPAHLFAIYKRTGGLTANELSSMGAAVVATVNDLDVSHIWKAFETARENGVNKPKIHVDGYTFKMAPEYGANKGAIYVIEDKSGFNEYLGKILNGKFFPTRTCTQEHRDCIIATARNPLEAVLAFGRKFGKCSICARKLTDPQSMQMGVGPICRSKFGL